MAGRKGIGGHQSAKMLTDIWLTPPEIVERLGPFDLDPSSPVERPWPTAAKHYTIEDDGLSQPWEGFVWCNPPYGNQTQHWMKKMAEHGNGIALIFARTETGMFFEHVWPHASAVLFIEGRLFFYSLKDGVATKATANSGAPSILIAYGEEGRERLRNCDIGGVFIDTWATKDGWTMKTVR